MPWEQKEIGEIKTMKKHLIIRDTIRLAYSFINDMRNTTGSFNDYIFSFSDTLICIFEGEINFALKRASYFSTYLVATEFKIKFFIRYLGHGKFLFNSRYNMIIGPTIDEVSEWHDKGIFEGIYTAPSAILYNFDNLKNESLGNPFVKYIIKIKKF